MIKPAKPILVTIDGPAGAGKTTVSRKLAAAIGYKYIDTGCALPGSGTGGPPCRCRLGG